MTRNPSPSVIVYGPISAPFTRKVLAALAVKGLAHRLVEPAGPEDYKRWSPESGLLPVAEIEGKRIPDSGKILDALDEHYPEPPLLAADPKVAGAQRRLEVWVTESFLFYWGAYLRAIVEARAGGAKPQQELNRGLGVEFGQRIDDLVQFLGDRPYFYADRVSRADLTVYSFLARSDEFIGPEIGERIRMRRPLRDHLRRIDDQVKGILTGDPSSEID